VLIQFTKKKRLYRTSRIEIKETQTIEGTRHRSLSGRAHQQSALAKGAFCGARATESFPTADTYHVNRKDEQRKKEAHV
jgi:hypothetical protein